MSETCLVCFRDGVEPETAVALSNGFRHIECDRLDEGDYWPFEHHVFPNGEVWYRDSDHSYFTQVKPVTQGRGAGKGIVGYSGVGAAEIPSPSSIAKFADPNVDQLMGYVLRVEEGELTDHEKALLAAAKDLGVNLDQPRYLVLRDCKGAVGTLAHKAMEKVLVAETLVGAVFETHPVAQGYIDAVLQFFSDLGHFKTLNAEQVVFSSKHQYAGRFDAQIVSRKEWQPETWLIDLKTSSFIGRSYHNQLAGYDAAAEECGVGASDRLIILQVREDGSYTPWPCRGTREGFYLNLKTYRDGKRMDAETRRDWRELVSA